MTIPITDRLEIEDLAARYNLAVDLGDPAGWVSCFLPDAEFAIGALSAYRSGRGHPVPATYLAGSECMRVWNP
jgi:hypothetical protein